MQHRVGPRTLRREAREALAQLGAVEGRQALRLAPDPAPVGQKGVQTLHHVLAPAVLPGGCPPFQHASQQRRRAGTTLVPRRVPVEEEGLLQGLRGGATAAGATGAAHTGAVGGTNGDDVPQPQPTGPTLLLG